MHTLSLPECPRGCVLFRGPWEGVLSPASSPPPPPPWLSLHILICQQRGLGSKGHQPPSKGRLFQSSPDSPALWLGQSMVG